MTRTSDPREPRRKRLRLIEPQEPTGKKMPLPAVVLVLGSEQTISPAQDALLTGLARRARLGDRDARDLLWRALAPRLEPAQLRRGRLAWQSDGAWRDGQPWDLDDVRQEEWLVFSQLVEWWNGEGSFIPYAIAYFPWQLRGAVRRLRPQRRAIPAHLAPEPMTVAECGGLLDIESADLLESIAAVLSPLDAEILRLRIGEGATFDNIASRLSLSQRTIIRRWKRIQEAARAVLAEPG